MGVRFPPPAPTLHQTPRRPLAALGTRPGAAAVVQAGPVRIALYDLNGRLVRVILAESRTAGDHAVTWIASGGDRQVALGVYFMEIHTGEIRDGRRVTVLK